jgi:hypothetical protein
MKQPTFYESCTIDDVRYYNFREDLWTAIPKSDFPKVIYRRVRYGMQEYKVDSCGRHTAFNLGVWKDNSKMYRFEDSMSRNGYATKEEANAEYLQSLERAVECAKEELENFKLKLLEERAK